MHLYDSADENISSTPIDFTPIDELLSKPRIKKEMDASALSKYPNNSLYLYRRNMAAMLAFSAASMGTAALILLNSDMFR
jgi:hypothetical protein